MAVSKIQEYIEQRVAGVEPVAAGLAVGYSLAGLAVTISRLESRDDVRKAIRGGKRGQSRKPVPARGQEPDTDGVPEALKPWALRDRYSSPLDLMLDVMNNKKAPGGLRIQCAKDAMPYCHARKEGGKKEDDKARANETNKTSKFGSQAMPSRLQRVA